ncbi:MAG: hypothetical protein E7449_04160 [Ruminococcaceae bacterium]|nr:hypothetical protein [Oscillospiraceae bacterium]
MKKQKLVILLAAVLVIALLSALVTRCARQLKFPLEQLSVDQLSVEQIVEIVHQRIAVLYHAPEHGWLEADEIDFSNLSVGNPVYTYEYMGGEEDAFRRSAYCICIVYSGDQPLCNASITVSNGEPLTTISAGRTGILPVSGKEAALVYTQNACYAYCDGEFVKLHSISSVHTMDRAVLDPDTVTVKEGELILTDGLSPNGVHHPIPPVENPE